MEKQKALDVLSALAQEARLDVFRLLVGSGPDGLAAGDIADALDVQSATLSFHLKELKNAGIVGCRRNGRSRIYTPNFAAMKDLVQFLTENCCREVTACAPRISTDSTAASEGAR
jgi:DNA-binding transcriptional ArsR family regulator